MKKVSAAKWVAMACVAVMASGCSNAMKPTNAKLEVALNRYFESHNECLYPQGKMFPYEVSPGKDAKAEERRMDALKAAGLLKELKDLDLHVERYMLTAMGERVAPRFCYGHKVVASIDGFTDPVKDGNVVESTVSYHAKMVDVPVWAQTEELMKAFPEMGKAISGSRPGKIEMGTAGVGWSVR
ncbi:MAG TPA: hypothetical protein VMU92_02770 [Acidobacteriaceae bacterium]|nr:hypothetical protein [Acidobacteriaceae bacterium]